MKCMLLGMAGAFIILLLAAIFIPAYSDYTDRAITSEILISIKDLQRNIEGKLLQKKRVGISTSAIKIKSEHISKIKVLDDGTIRIKGGKIGQVIILVPEVIDEKLVNWECIGGPNQAMPPNCKSA